MKLFRYIGCAIKGHYWLYIKKYKKERRETKYRFGISGNQTFEGIPYFIEDEYILWQCKYCKRSVTGIAYVKPNNSRRKKYEALKKKETWKELWATIKKEE